MVVEKWFEEKLGNLLIILKDGTHNPPDRKSKGIPLLASESIHDGIIDFKKGNYISEKDYFILQKKYKISINDLLLTIVGTIGRVSMVNEKIPFSVQRSVAILRTNNRIIPKFLYYYISSSFFRF